MANFNPIDTSTKGSVHKPTSTNKTLGLTSDGSGTRNLDFE